MLEEIFKATKADLAATLFDVGNCLNPNCEISIPFKSAYENAYYKEQRRDEERMLRVLNFDNIKKYILKSLAKLPRHGRGRFDGHVLSDYLDFSMMDKEVAMSFMYYSELARKNPGDYKLFNDVVMGE